MASKYLQKYQVPEGFYDVLHEFTREVLRAQPEDILEYAANYFEHKNVGKEYYYESRNNVQRPANKQASKQYQPTPHAVYSEQGKQIVAISNAHTSTVPSKQPAHRTPSAVSVASEAQVRPPTTHSVNSDLGSNVNDTSKISHHSKKSEVSNRSRKSDISHPEEKLISKEFVGDIYSSAIMQVISSSQERENLTEESIFKAQQAHELESEVQKEEEEESSAQVDQAQEQEEEENSQIQPAYEQSIDQAQSKQEQEVVVLDGPVEDYQNVAVKIQSVFRGNQVRKGTKNLQ